MDRPTDEAQPIDALLAELQQESEQRRAELRAIAADLPEATSRRAVLRSMVGDIAHAPDRTLVAKRVALKVLRIPADLVRRVRAR